MILGDEIVDEALATHEAAIFANPNRVQRAAVPRRTSRCSTCLVQTNGAKAKNNLKKVNLKGTVFW
jgi:hypothetical protein